MDSELANLLADIHVSAKIQPAALLPNVKDGYASIYIFDIKPGAMVYRYDVELYQLRQKGEPKSLTKKSGDDGKRGLLRGVCFELINKLCTLTGGFGKQAIFVYDNSKILFTNKFIDPMKFDIPPEQMPAHVRTFLRNTSVRVEIKPCEKERHKFQLDDLKPSLSESPEKPSDRSLRTFLEMLTSQYFINAGTHELIGIGRLFEKQIVRQLDAGIVTKKGIAKGVRIIDHIDPNGNRNPRAALVADVKTCAFFANENLLEIVKRMMQPKKGPRGGPGINVNNKAQMDTFRADFAKLFNGVSGTLTYDPSRIIIIESLTLRTLAELSFEVDGHPMSMVEFFAKKKQVQVDGRMPAVRQQGPDRETLFPMECIVILPNQRIPIEKMSDEISRTLLDANTTDPDRRYAAIEAEVKKIGTGDCYQFMRMFGARLVGGQNNVKIGIHDLPKVKFGGNLETSFADRINPAVRFLETSTILKTWIVAHPRQVPEQDIRKFIDDLIRMGRNRGMQLPAPRYEDIEFEEIGPKMEALAKNKVQFVVYIDKKFVKSHGVLKISEKRYGILTQHVTWEVAVKARAMTLSNVLNKMNMKLYGFNYMPILSSVVKNKFNMEKGNVLVIGVDSSRPPKATPHEKFMMRKKGMGDLDSEDPMIVGICANYLSNPFKFCGDYYYQPSKQDVLEPSALKYKIRWILEKVKKIRMQPPSVVFIIRDGVSEGMVPDNVRDEFPTYVQACREFSSNWKPKFIYCIVDKKQNKRFFLKGEQPGVVQNTTPGCVIDSEVTRMDVHEFWLQSHTPLKGTAKIPQYVFPVNETNANNMELQGLLLMLCHNWQIVNLAPALPTPVRQAAELAKRGLHNYQELKRSNPTLVPRVPGTLAIDCNQLNARLCYNGGLLADTRFNA